MDATVSSSPPYPSRRYSNHFLRKMNRRRTNSTRLSVAKATFRENTYQFSQNTTLHAWKFMGDRTISPCERIFFFCAFAVAISVAFNFTYEIYEKWSSTPVIIANSASSTYISQIPFPAVTICNMNQALKSKVSNLDRNTVQYSILQPLCNRREKVYNQSIKITPKDFEDFITEASQPCHHMLLVCKFGSVEFNCSEFFQTTFTEEGRCCTFNAVDPAFMYKNYKDGPKVSEYMPKGYFAVDWKPETGYPSVRPKNFYPTVSYATGYTMGLTLIIDAEIHEYYCSSSNGPGFKVALHSPIETPNVADIGFSVAAGFETRVVVTPQLSDASSSIRQMRKETRQCVFNNEMNLTYFRTYSRRNCEMECAARLLTEQCNCIMAYMPRFRRNIRICGASDGPCYDASNAKVQAANAESNNCSAQCMSACFELTYDVANYAAPILGGPYLIRRRVLQNMPRSYAEKNCAVVHFYYIENAFRSRTKEQFFGFTEFLSSTGGLMSLFIGFSVISLVEIVYYGSIRPICNNRRYKTQLKHVRPATAKTEKLQTDAGNINTLFGSPIHSINLARLDYGPSGRTLRKVHGFNITGGSQIVADSIK